MVGVIVIFVGVVNRSVVSKLLVIFIVIFVKILLVVGVIKIRLVYLVNLIWFIVVFVVGLSNELEIILLFIVCIVKGVIKCFVELVMMILIL